MPADEAASSAPLSSPRPPLPVLPPRPGSSAPCPGPSPSMTSLLCSPGGEEGAPVPGPEPDREARFPERGPGRVPGRGLRVRRSRPQEGWGALRLLKRLLPPHSWDPAWRAPRLAWSMGPSAPAESGPLGWTVSLGLQEVGTAQQMDGCGGRALPSQSPCGPALTPPTSPGLSARAVPPPPEAPFSSCVSSSPRLKKRLRHA